MVAIPPMGMEIIFSEINSRFISDSNTTKKKSDVISWVGEEHEIMSDKGLFKHAMSEQ